MVARIIRVPNGFLLVLASKGFCLSISSTDRLKLYKDDKKLLDADHRVLQGFASAKNNKDNKENLKGAIGTLVKEYGLGRRPVLKPDKVVSFIIQDEEKIANCAHVCLSSIASIGDTFQELQTDLAKELGRKQHFPKVSLSKLLHFLHPESFWIVDSRVLGILNIFGYRPSFRGFGDFLKEISHDPKFINFKEFLETKERELLGNHPVSNFPPYFLKLLDKLLWFR